jgi:P2 family phage contractile tail tube protein
MTYKRILRDYTLYSDDDSYRGRCLSFNPPAIQPQIVDYRAGGLDGSLGIDMGLNLGDAVATFGGFEPGILAAVGRMSSEVRLVVRGALISQGEAETQLIYEIRGVVREYDPGTMQPGESAPSSVTIKPHFFQIEHEGQVLFKADVRNNERIVGGTDQLETLRTALGL